MHEITLILKQFSSLCRYNDQMSEVKRELKSCKTKMETQTKQVQEYSQRLEDYDKKFEESSRKFQNMLTVSNFLLGWRKRYMIYEQLQLTNGANFQELNKCKTELQFWRSKSHVVLGGAVASGASSGTTAAGCQACGGGGIAQPGTSRFPDQILDGNIFVLDKLICT